MTAVAPDLTIELIDAAKSRETVRLSVDEEGGTYDTISYRWTLLPDGGLIGTTANPVWEYPVVVEDVWVTIRCEVTVRGTGTNADDGTSDTNFEEQRVRVLHVDLADAPEITLGSIPNAQERTTQNMSLQLTGGNYDRLTYRWQTFNNFDGTEYTGAFSDDTAAAPVWTRPDVDGNTTVNVRCTITAHGENVNALLRNTDSLYRETRTTILAAPHATAPSSLHIDHNTGDPDNESEWGQTSGTGTEHTPVWIRTRWDNDGNYDNITYAWQWKFHSENENAWRTITGATTKQFQWTYPSTAIRQQYDFRVRLDVGGTDDQAEINTTDSIVHHVDATAVYIDPLPDASASSNQRLEHLNENGTYSTGVPDGIEGSHQTIALFNNNDALFDSRRHVWLVTRLSDNTDVTATVLTGTFDSATTWNRERVSSDTQYRIRCTEEVEGADNHANFGSTDSAHAEVTTWVRAHQPTDVPSINVTAVPDGQSGSTVQLVPILGMSNAGRYDTLEYRWQIWAVGDDPTAGDVADTVLDDKTLRSPTWTRPHVTSNTRYQIRCNLTARGTDVHAETGTSETTFNTGNTAVLATVTPLPSAVHPAITIDSIASGPEGTKVQIYGHATGGTYDRVRWFWRLETIISDSDQENSDLDGTTETITWQRPAIVENEDVRWDISAFVRAYGDGVNARDGTSNDSTRFRIHAPVEAYTPPAFIVRLTDDDGTPINITGMAITNDNGEVQTITGVRITDSNGTATEIYDGN